MVAQLTIRPFIQESYFLGPYPMFLKCLSCFVVGPLVILKATLNMDLGPYLKIFLARLSSRPPDQDIDVEYIFLGITAFGLVGCVDRQG